MKSRKCKDNGDNSPIPLINNLRTAEDNDKGTKLVMLDLHLHFTKEDVLMFDDIHRFQEPEAIFHCICTP